MVIPFRALADSALGSPPLVQTLVFDKLHVRPTALSTLIYDGIVVAVVFVGLASAVAMFGIWWERKVAGHIQSRLGPNRVGPLGLLQSMADGAKLLLKEDLVPAGADSFLFRLAPYLACTPVFAAFGVLPFAPELTFEPRLNAGAFWAMAILGVEVMGVVLAGWASNNKWSIYGAMRQASQMVSYQVPLGLSIVIAVMTAGTLNLVQLGHLQGGGLHTWLLFRNPFAFLAFFVFFIASLAALKRAPFDLPESQSELVAGYHTEYSGLRFGFFAFAEYAGMFVIAGIQVGLFLGSWNDPLGLIGWAHARFAAPLHHDPARLLLVNAAAAAIFILKCLGIMYVQLWLRWTLPRPRIDQVLHAGIKVLLPMACVLLLGAALWQLLVGDLQAVPWMPFQAGGPLAGQVFNPWNFAQWFRAGAGPALVAQVVLALTGATATALIVAWAAYSFAVGERVKKRLIDFG